MNEWMNACIPDVFKAMRECVKESGPARLSGSIAADYPADTSARGRYFLSQFDFLAEECARLVDGYVAGGTVETVVRGNFPRQRLRDHRAGHGSDTSQRTQRGYVAFVHTKMLCAFGASVRHARAPRALAREIFAASTFETMIFVVDATGTLLYAILDCRIGHVQQWWARLL